MKIIKTVWFDKIGIVIKENAITKKRRAYIGVGRGHDEGLDVKDILENGIMVQDYLLEELLDALR